jgi:class 3 adenylate cyclase/tetratricopeptide (TPR) repeat protein
MGLGRVDAVGESAFGVAGSAAYPQPVAEHVSDGTRCRTCGEVNRAERKFCGQCGTALGVACPSCGTANEPSERFCGECGTALEAGAAPLRGAVTSGVERRLVSVLFADLVGHTMLSEQRDVEDVRYLLTRYGDVARVIVERYGGEIEKFIGDAVMAVWGTPTAREDDAERAVRAALDLTPAVAALGAELGAPTLAARAAVLTGEAAVTLGAQGQGMVAGDLVNTASRVQALAERGTVLVGDATRRATEAAISYEDAGAHELRGKAEPVQLWRALRIAAGRGGSLRSDTLEPPFVGREREHRLLKELFHASADERKAHLVSIVGIAGIGKTRLTSELQKYFDGVAQTVQWHRGRCLAYGEGVSFWALAEMVRMWAEIVEGEEPESARTKLRSALERYVADRDEREWIEPRLAQLLALEEAGDGDRSDLFAGWRLFLERLAEQDPVVLVFEDMQWADAPLLEFLEYLLEWSRSHRLYVLALARPEFGERHPAWGSSIRNSTTLSLEPLSDQAMQELLEGFAPGLPEKVRRQVLERAEGVPLYAVETVRMLLDKGLLEQHGSQYRPTGPIPALEIPETLHALAAARLDGLMEEERRLVQDASVVGKTFIREALVAVTSIPDDFVDQLLTALARKEILSLDVDPRSPERGQYAFLQDLLRQVAYETMPRSDRKRRHLAAASYFEQGWPEGEQEVAEIVASHYLTALELDPDAEDAGEIEVRARSTLVKAGERAASLAATESGQRYFEQALELTDTPLERAELHERAGIMAVRGGRTAEARKHLEQAIAGLGELGHTHRAARVSARLATDVTWGQEHDIERALADMERSFAALADDERDADLALLAVQSARVLYFSGRVDAAMARNELALEIAEALWLPFVLSHGLNTKGLSYTQHGRREEGMLLMRHSLEMALAHDLLEPAVRAYVNLTALTASADRRRDALELSRAGAELARKLGERQGELAFESWTIGLLVTLGEWDEAEALLETLSDPLYLPLTPPVRRGDLEEGRRRLERMRNRADLNELQHRAGVRADEAFLLVADGKMSEALVAAEEAIALREKLGLTEGSVEWALEEALEAAFALEDRAKADELLGLIEELPPGELTPSLRAMGARFSARRSALDGDDATANAAFLAAADIFREIEVPFSLAVVRVEHAESLAACGRIDDAQSFLDEARGIFERLRATPWLERLDRIGRAKTEPVAVD